MSDYAKAADARTDVHREPADVVVGEQSAFAGVQTSANLKVEVADPVADPGEYRVPAPEDQPTRQGYLLLADISGYTAFLTGTELEHARERALGRLTSASWRPDSGPARCRFHAGFDAIPQAASVVSVALMMASAWRDDQGSER